MAYVLGYLYADGSLEDASYLRGLYTRVSSIDYTTIVTIKELLDSKHTIVPISPQTPSSHTRYLLRIGDKDIYLSLLQLGLTPNKSHTMKFPDVPQRFLPDFVRGYFDGDGCVYVAQSAGKSRVKILRGLTTIFTSGSASFLATLANKLGFILALKQKKVYSSHRSFQLRYTTADSIKLFCFMYKRPEIYLKRKAQKFTTYFALQPKRTTLENRRIIKKLTATW